MKKSDFFLFSIIIPVKGINSNLFSCLSCLLNQSFRNFQIVIINSLDKIGYSCFPLEFRGLNIIFVNEFDFGIYDAMNKGLVFSSGKWIYFLGSDDVLYDDWVLEKLSRICSNSFFPVVYGNVLLNGNSGWAKNGEIYAGKFSKNRMLLKSICHQAIFYRRDFLISNNLFFDLRYPVSADWHLNLRCRRLTRFKYVDIIVAVFAAGGISTSKRDSFPDQIKTEFADMYPSATEIFIKETVKKILRLFR